MGGGGAFMTPILTSMVVSTIIVTNMIGTRLPHTILMI